VRQIRRFAPATRDEAAGAAPAVPALAEVTAAVGADGAQSLAGRVLVESARHGEAPPEESMADAVRAVALLEGAVGLHADLIDPRKVRELEARSEDPIAGGLGGSWLLGRASELIAACGDEAVVAWAKTSHQLVRSRMIEFEDLYDAGRHPERYLDVAEMRTGGLLSLACHLGCLLSAATPKVDSALREYGRELGIASEIRADVDALGASEGADSSAWRLGSGNYPLPLLYALESNPGLAATLGKPLAADAIAPVTDAIRESGGLARAEEECRRRTEAAKATLAGIGADTLLELADEAGGER
jgi:geranylgeranyl pyrophosphate synthase